MTIKKKVLIILSAALFLILLFLLIWFLSKQTPAPVVVVTNETNDQAARPRENEDETPPPAESVDVSLQSLALTFAERYGSYSTETDFANLYDVMVLMSASLKAQTENFIASAKVSNEYYGVTTRVLSVEVTSSTAASGTVEVATQREESKGGPQNSEISYQKLLLSCLKEGGVWKVASATWQ